jgi:hypothetical protein
MYVWGRLARMVATAKSRGPFRPGDESRLKFRCLPSDIDRNMHLNNARYMMLADVGRVDIFLRLGFLKLARQKGWGPMMGGLQSVYVREIKLWQRFEVVTAASCRSTNSSPSSASKPPRARSCPRKKPSSPPIKACAIWRSRLELTGAEWSVR